MDNLEKTLHQIQDTEKISLETAIEIPRDFDFNEEFQQAFDLLEHSKNHVIITGKAGTGKSTLLEYFRQKTQKNIVVLAPTGVAAIKVSGQTIHSFFKLPPKFIHKDVVNRLRNREVMETLETLVIDEASMVRADLLDGIDYALRINRNNLDEPFGGVQVILFADLFQLSPVVDRDISDMMFKLYRTPYFFSAEVFNEINVEYFELNKIYRQKNPEFIKLLNKIRVKDIKTEDLFKLNQRLNREIGYGAQGIITLTATNRHANSINQHCLDKIASEEFTFRANTWGDFDEKNSPAEAVLKLKRKAQVMMIKNDPEKRWVNGTLGEIAGVTERSIQVDIRGEIIEVPRVSWEKIEYNYNREAERIEEKIVGTFEQYPIKLAWAITIHKSQGQTFDHVIIDLEQGAFSHGQVYVALSRCTSLEGIILKQPVNYDDIIFDARIYEFYKNFYPHTKNFGVGVHTPRLPTSMFPIEQIKKRQPLAAPEKNLIQREFKAGERIRLKFDLKWEGFVVEVLNPAKKDAPHYVIKLDGYPEMRRVYNSELIPAKIKRNL